MLHTTLHYNAPVTKVTSGLYLYSRTQSAAAVSPTVPSDLPAAPQAASKFLRELGTSGLSVSIANICTLPMGEQQQQLLKCVSQAQPPCPWTDSMGLQMLSRSGYSFRPGSLEVLHPWGW